MHFLHSRVLPIISDRRADRVAHDTLRADRAVRNANRAIEELRRLEGRW